jgi:hypothetical protein
VRVHPHRLRGPREGDLPVDAAPRGRATEREHYGCVDDLLGRAGRVEEAETVLLDLDVPMEPHASQWGALMSTCRVHNDITVREAAT